MSEENPHYIIALDTATQTSSVGLFNHNQLMGIIEYTGYKQHARLLMPMIKTLLTDFGVPRSEIGAVAVGKGPGSYTGLRVGVSTAKGLAMSLECPLLSFNSLDSLALQATDLAEALDAWICPMIDARRMEVYTSLYDATGKVQKETHALVVDEQSFSELLQERKIIFLGDATQKIAPLFRNYKNAIFLLDKTNSVRALGSLLTEKLSAQQFENLVTFEPYYLKEFVATKAKNPLI